LTRKTGEAKEDLGKVAIYERQVDDGFLIDDASQSGILRLKERRLGTILYLFLCATDHKLNLQTAHLGDLNLKAFQDELLKSGRANRQVIFARREEWDQEIPLGIRSKIALFTCGLAVDDQCRTGYQRSTGVAHGASDRSGIGRLAVRRQSAEREHKGQEQGAERVHRAAPHHPVPPKALIAGSWPAPPWPNGGPLPARSHAGAHSIHQEVIGIRVLAIHSELALFVQFGRR
jgi:hypothetical protein